MRTALQCWSTIMLLLWPCLQSSHKRNCVTPPYAPWVPLCSGTNLCSYWVLHTPQWLSICLSYLAVPCMLLIDRILANRHYIADCQATCVLPVLFIVCKPRLLLIGIHCWIPFMPTILLLLSPWLVILLDITSLCTSVFWVCATRTWCTTQSWQPRILRTCPLH